jgi:predicted ATPase/DNA-binding SARP family transcriptional activator
MAVGTRIGKAGPAQFHILGPLEVVRSGCAVPLGGARQRAVLARLLLEANRLVSVDRLAEDVWDGHPPRGSVTTLHTYVFHLRRALEPDRSPGAAGDVLVTKDRGYLMRVNREHLDAVIFEDEATAGQAALEAGRYGEAAQTLRAALGLWRGPVLADLADYGFARPEAARLEELRLTAVEDRIEADLALGRHQALTGDLERLVGEYPLRERLHAQLMLALYRCGRQADALATYRRAREMLAAELGLEPGEELRALEQAVLRQEVPPVPSPARHNLPAPLTSFLGRDQEMAWLERLLGEARLVTLTGTGGGGKTRLALEAGARVMGWFPDGVWLADLAGINSPGLVAIQVMGALGVRQEAGVPVMEALRYRLHSAQLLLVLDNCEHLLDACAELAGALLGGSPGLRVLATSREPLGVPGEVAYQVLPLSMPPEPAGEEALAAAPAVQLFLDRASAARGGTTLGVAPVAVTGRICRTLDGLPLAIELAAARMGTLSAAEIEAHLADRFAFLAYRRPVPDPRHQTLQAAMDWSYELLPPHERRVLGELSVFAASFGLAEVAEVCGGGDQAGALEMIDRLAAKSLVAAEPVMDGTRYRLLETIRQYAAGRLAESGGAKAARQRHARAFLSLAERERALAPMARDLDNFRAALDWSLSIGDQTGPRLAHALGGFWLGRGLLAEGRDWLERALAQGPADEHLRAGLLRLLATVLNESGDLKRVEAVLAEGSRVAAEADLRAAGARIRLLLTQFHAEQCGSTEEALEECAATAAILESEGDLAGLAEAWKLAGMLHYWLGDVPACQEALDRAAAYARRSGNHYTERQASLWLGVSFSALHVPADVAISHLEPMLQTASGDPWAKANILMWLALQYGYAGRVADARQAAAQSGQMLTEIGAKIQWAILCAEVAGQIEFIAGDAAAAEHHIRNGYQALRQMGSGYLSSPTCLLAEAVYAQDRLEEAEQLTKEAEAIAPDDFEQQARWRATRAKLLARRGQFATARRLADQADALVSPTSYAALMAEVLMAKAEVNRLAGACDQAAVSLRAALRIYEDRRAVLLAERTRTTLANLTAHPGPGPV